ncbi:mannosylglucosyl-3-phosphoglycerate phosphatase isoform X3 [Sitodiplosis mosellana]|nr:mannosylglucosyl-3-phosphoglycerate phosphatase isoform X3 [Sitodiplosis mosellana]XP_055319482.1 mannosylglucosyl-3-phosphoglycerate phosphatase isoform X3 [Sitodiplosis mosellana]XP_055319483.1 mannosylglucosyl-3-phosphoglycerate phosphatase isoform X3 [Sitodiplosis mosellana]XP_055319484.1 mannosylglucosyl-3-phosphoglycerate phosphatase isoform X3 [Sitodiplosis mosellana]XP_055319485.1 mannosylglucosyl-3-phosphoglycerate phosphatase isoform X3 [Sitodiplosis mosellana]XP_055319486.1 manno
MAHLNIIHFNDIYNVEPNSSREPVGGAARFLTVIKSYANLNPLILFSGDAFSPSILSTFTKGEQMIPVLNKVGTHCAVLGNHDFDHGLEVITEHIAKTSFPWLMSNVVDNETGRPLGSGKNTHVIEHNGIKVGIMGLVEKEWLDTLPTIDPKEVTYTDFIKTGNKLATQLRNEGCDLIIALTHMRTPNDFKLANNTSGIDIILGGHDHVCEDDVVNGIHVIKSGTDFRQFGLITMTAGDDKKWATTFKAIDVTSDYAEDVELKAELAKFTDSIEEHMKEVLGTFSVELDGRFSKIRTSEVNLGDWVCDVVLSATGADVVILNSGTFRSDQVHPAGPFTMRDLVNVVPMHDPLVVLEVTGRAIVDALENAVSAYPKLEGRFPQVSGISFVFDPKRPPYSRVITELVQVADEWLDLKQTYSLCIKSYMRGGCDGFTMFKNSKIIMGEDECPELGLTLQNHFRAIDVRMGKTKHSKHRQSLVTLSRRHSMVQMLENLELDGPTPMRRISLSSAPNTNHYLHHLQQHQSTRTMDASMRRANFGRRASLEDLEQESCQLAPATHHRIIQLQNEEHLQLLLQKKAILETNRSVITEDDETSPQT